jgi:phosphate transport system substrate-binding protein
MPSLPRSNIPVHVQGSALLLGVLSVLTAVLLAACGSDDESTSDTSGDSAGQSALDLGSLSGEIRIDGSSTVFPISEAVAEEFSKVSGTRVNVAFSGTGGGFEKFCRGEIEIADASRPIKGDERQVCDGNGIDDIVEVQIGIDALTVVVNPANDFAKCLSVRQLNQIFKAGGATKWNQIDPSWPDQNIVYYYPGKDSGTYDYFQETILTGVDGSQHYDGPSSSEDDNVLALGVEGDNYAIGYFGIAYFLGAGQNLKAVAVDQHGDGNCVAPSAETALNRTYEPLSRPLFIYTRESFLKERPEVLGFVNFYLENVQTLVPQAGYIQLPEDTLQAQFATIEPFLN